MIAYLFGGVKNYDKGLLKVTNLVNNTMQELGMGIKELNLGPPSTIPYYDGVRSSQVQEIIENIRAASGVIFATTAGGSGASAVLHTFLEHLEQERNILKDKNCMIIVMSTTGDYDVVNYLSRYITNLGGYDSVRMLLDQAFFERSSNQDIAEKQIEDFYRMIRQKRKFYKPIEVVSFDQPNNHDMDQVRPYVFPTEQTRIKEQASLYNNQYPQYNEPKSYEQQQSYEPQSYEPQSYEPQINKQQSQQIDNKTQSMLQNYESLNKQNQQGQGAVYTPSGNQYPNVQYQRNDQPSAFANQNHQEDVADIASFFSKKISQPHPTPNVQNQNFWGNNQQGFSPTINPSLPNSPANQWFANDTDSSGRKTARQLTASLIHHYQPQLAGDLSCVLQMDISGQNGFSGYIVINGQNADYYDGKTENPSLTVISDETNWVNVITGKMSAQKAFMTGTLKIKGNFVLLTRFDQIFNTSKNY